MNLCYKAQADACANEIFLITKDGTQPCANMGHAFKKELKKNKPQALKLFAVDAENKAYEFWQRDSLAYEPIKKETISQKIDYIHYNPTAEKWKLCNDPIDYYYSSAKFYASGIDNFGFLKHIGDIL